MTDKKIFVPSCLRVSDVLEQHFDTATGKLSELLDAVMAQV